VDVERIRAEVEAAGKEHLAAATAGDVETVDRLIADEIFYTHSNGFTDADKAAYLEFIRSAHYVDIGMTVEHEVERIIVLNEDLAIVKGRQVTNNTSPTIGVKWTDVRATSTDTWIRRDGRWQLIAHQSTLVLDGDAYRKAFVAGHAVEETVGA
jgi:hypothetical protein